MITDELIAELIEQGKKIKTYSINKAAVGSAIELLLSARAEIEQLREAQRWIPISERVPEVDELMLTLNPVLAYNGVIWTAILWKNGQWMDDSGHEELDNITHWMPLPTPPEEAE